MCESPTFVEDLGVSLVQQVLQLVIINVSSCDLKLPLQMVLLPVIEQTERDEMSMSAYWRLVGGFIY